MRLPENRILSPLARPFPERAARWRRARIDETETRRLDGEVLLRRFALPSPDAAARGRRIAFFSDLHFHGTAVEKRRIAALAEALTELRPDLLLCGGDLAGDATDLPGMAPHLRRLAACAPAALTVPGNWERGKTWLSTGRWRELYRDCGFELVDNAELDCGGIFVYGGDDLIHGDPELPPPRRADGRLRIFLSHRPDAVVSCDCGDHLAAYTLALCGHTHGGQWRIPGFGALFVPSFYGRRFDRGWFRREGRGAWMFVSSGLGELSLHGRFCCRREAAVIDFA